jgi:hypothetical protein
MSSERENDMKRARVKNLHYNHAESGVKHFAVISRQSLIALSVESGAKT